MGKMKVKITVVKNDNHGFVCVCDYPFGKFELGGSGNSVEEAKEDCFVFYDEMREMFPEDNLPDLEVEWYYDLPSFFNQFDFFNITKVAEYAEISPSNFRHYVAGSKPVSSNQMNKIKTAFDKMATELHNSALTIATS